MSYLARQATRAKKASDVILIALGSNQPHPDYGAPNQVLRAALSLLPDWGLQPQSVSSLYSSAPWPPSSQARYCNAVASIKAPGLEPALILERLHAIEAEFGRIRRVRNEARVLDLDLLAYGDLVRSEAPILPHPRLHERAFVLVPLAEIAPQWRHPISGEGITSLQAQVPAGQDLQIWERSANS